MRLADALDPPDVAAGPRKLTFVEFVTLVRPTFRWYRHCVILADVLQRMADGKIKRLMVFMPPRHGKSELVSRLFSAYFLYLYPERWVALCCYGADLVNMLSRAARTNYRASGAPVAQDSASVQLWETGRGGGLWAAGVGGSLTGKGFQLGILDDPLKGNEAASSETIREGQKEWYRSDFYTREEPWSETDSTAAIVMVLTRWHEDDLAGWQLAEEANEDSDDEHEHWHIVNLEAIMDAEPQKFPATCTVEPDWRQPGEPLCPERRPLSKLNAIKARIGAYFFGALFQQRPASKEGAFFHVSQIEIADNPPRHLLECRAWDIAATKDGGDWTVGAKVGMAADGVIWITDMVRGQWDTDEVDRQIRLTAGLDGHGVSIHGPQDPGAAGKKAGLGFIRLLLGFNVNVEPVSGHKQTRARGLSAQVNAGNVKMVKGNWNKAVIEEMRTFPVGKNDDIIDAASDATNEIAEQVPAPLAVAGAERSIPTQGIRDGVSAPAQQPVAGRRVVVNPGLAKVQSYRPR